MCYAIPGKVLEIKESIVFVDYFGEKKKARNEFYELSPGDYVYAQGGFVVKKIPPEEAIPILETWKELFFKLQEKDAQLARERKNLYQVANSIRQEHLGNSCCVHGIIEFSNYCRNNCLYCGLRRDNLKLKRYRMDIDEIVDLCDYAVNQLGFKAIVLQSGEDLWYREEKLVIMVEKVRERCPALIVLSIGERDISTYEKLYDAGARGVLLRFETGNEKLYKTLKPGHELRDRIQLIVKLSKMGYLVFTGFLVGLPGQTMKDIIKDIHLTHDLGAEMFSFGPFIPHPDTPLGHEKRPGIKLALTTIAKARIMYPDAKILVTTAVETLDKNNGARLGLQSGGNSIMINLTPPEYRKHYEIYPDRADNEVDVKVKIAKVLELLQSLGRAPTDIGISSFKS
jgi:biotin synthase